MWPYQPFWALLGWEEMVCFLCLLSFWDSKQQKLQLLFLKSIFNWIQPFRTYESLCVYRRSHRGGVWVWTSFWSLNRVFALVFTLHCEMIRWLKCAREFRGWPRCVKMGHGSGQALCRRQAGRCVGYWEWVGVFVLIKVNLEWELFAPYSCHWLSQCCCDIENSYAECLQCLFCVDVFLQKQKDSAGLSNRFWVVF